MIKCNHCDRLYDDAAVACPGCGCTPATPSLGGVKFLISLRTKVFSGRLDAWSATFILFAIVATQVLLGVIMATAATFSVGSRVALAYLNPLSIVLGWIVAGAVLIRLSILCFRSDINNASSHGAAWITGKGRHNAQACCLGFVAGVVPVAIARMAPGIISAKHIEQVSKAIQTDAARNIVIAFSAVLLAPLVEELLFRGVLYGGYRTSFGPFWAALITTLLFLVNHLPSVTFSLYSTIAITGLGLMALVVRLRWSAIGPAVALHIGYNLAVAIFKVM